MNIGTKDGLAAVEDLSPRRTRSCRKKRGISLNNEETIAHARVLDSGSAEDMRVDTETETETETSAKKMCSCSQDWCACGHLRELSVHDAWLAKEPVTEADDRLARLATQMSEHYRASFGHIQRIEAKDDRETPEDNTSTDEQLSGPDSSTGPARVREQNGTSEHRSKSLYTSEWMEGLVASLGEHVHFLAIHASQALAPESQGSTADDDERVVDALEDLHTSATLSSLYTVLSVTDTVSPQPLHTLCSDLVMASRVHPSVCVVLFAYISRTMPSVLRVEHTAGSNDDMGKTDICENATTPDVLVVELNDQTIVSTTLQAALSARLLDTDAPDFDLNDTNSGERVGSGRDTDNQAEQMAVEVSKHMYAHSKLAHKRLVVHRGWLDLTSAAEMTEECVEWCMTHLGVIAKNNNNNNDDEGAAREQTATDKRMTNNHLRPASDTSPLSVFSDTTVLMGPLSLLRVLFRTIANANVTTAYRYYYDNVARICVDALSAYRTASKELAVAVAAVLILGVGGATFHASCNSAKDLKMKQALLDFLLNMRNLKNADQVPGPLQTAIACAVLDLDGKFDGSYAMFDT